MLTCLVMVVLAIAIVGTVVVVSGEDNHGYTVPEGEDSGEVVPKAPPKEEGGKVEVEFPVDEERFHSILDYLVDSEVSVEKDLKTQNSPQSRAARWLSDEDEAQLSVGHFDMLQRYAMVTLFFSTTKVQQEWKKNDGWLTSSHICSWYGVKCGNHVPSTGALGKMSAAVGITPHVIHLNLTANNLNGELPPELSIMAKLKTLAIGGNKNLKGTIPTTLGKLHVLALLHLQENKLTGNIPSEIGGCTDLRDLHIDNNLLSGKIPTELSLLNSLHSFKITANRFTGPMPDVSSFKHLTDFWIDDNKFTGEIDPELSRVTTLKILRLNQNELVGTIPKSLGKLKKLVEFHFFNNHFKGEVPEDICEINTLHYIAGDCGIDESTDGEIECDCCTVCYR